MGKLGDKDADVCIAAAKALDQLELTDGFAIVPRDVTAALGKLRRLFAARYLNAVSPARAEGTRAGRAWTWASGARPAW